MLGFEQCVDGIVLWNSVYGQPLMYFFENSGCEYNYQRWDVDVSTISLYSSSAGWHG